MQIDGKTRLFAILAHPVGHVRTPEEMNKLFARADFAGVLVPMDVEPADLASALAGLRSMRNLGGFIVTVPHKVAIVELLDEVSPIARAIGAVNCVRREPDGRLTGTMLDGLGFVAGLRQAGIEPAGLSAYIAGAGGAAKAVAFALADAGISRLSIANRTPERSNEIAARLAGVRPDLKVDCAPASPAGHDLVVNCTSLGLRADDPLPIDLTPLDARQIVADIIMAPPETPLLVEAKARGCRTHPGLPMLTAQLRLMAAHMGVPL